MSRISFKAFFAFVIILMVAYVGIIATRSAQGKKTHIITVHTFSGEETYTTSEYKIDSVTRCVSFRDLIGIPRTICSNYSITTY